MSHKYLLLFDYKYYESPRASNSDKIYSTSLHSSGIVDTLLTYAWLSKYK